MWWTWSSCVRRGGGRTSLGASERQDHMRVRACALARACKGKERRGEKRRRRGNGEQHTFVCDDEGDRNGGAVMYRVAFHEFARTRRARCRDRERALMARARRRACGAQQAAAVAAALATATTVAVSSASSRHERPAVAAPAPRRRRCRSRRHLVACRETPPREVQRQR